MSFSLAPHPIGIKWWTNLWKTNKDLSGAELHAKFSDFVYHKTHRTIGRFFFPHRAGPLGVKAPLVVMFLGLKLGAMAYGAHRDRAAAVDVASAYGMGGHMVDAVPK
jgi:hypothetical protein